MTASISADFDECHSVTITGSRSCRKLAKRWQSSGTYGIVFAFPFVDCMRGIRTEPDSPQLHGVDFHLSPEVAMRGLVMDGEDRPLDPSALGVEAGGICAVAHRFTAALLYLSSKSRSSMGTQSAALSRPVTTLDLFHGVSKLFVSRESTIGEYEPQFRIKLSRDMNESKRSSNARV